MDLHVRLYNGHWPQPQSLDFRRCHLKKASTPSLRGMRCSCSVASQACAESQGNGVKIQPWEGGWREGQWNFDVRHSGGTWSLHLMQTVAVVSSIPCDRGGMPKQVEDIWEVELKTCRQDVLSLQKGRDGIAIGVEANSVLRSNFINKLCYTSSP